LATERSVQKRYRNISFSVREMNLVLKLAQQARLFTLP